MLQERTPPDWKKSTALLLLTAVPLLWYVWNRRHRPPDQEQIRLSIDKALEGIEERRLGKALSIVSDDYKDAEENRKRDLTRLAVGAFQSTTAIRVYVSALATEVQGNTAVTQLKATVAYTDATGQKLTEAYAPLLVWRKERRGWRVVSAQALTHPESMGN
ncbi:MAG: hypothetical protein AUJ92_03390 [Armatimonadetes bacterium CG2_30_59_28]|nr:hypothetical protein [Armatimonadota bacterium]OIO97552.1 MAG: hypothetical protein AUJ92_03390 [Armatimonadetes bacterium CG2_30_59_28]PIU62370.1 MAG: hypothetical protein COS85_18785 [Armatimonadetes bacterium CG07_land_8_20_14_0_80_59_28]PIX41447.1 MAG: hypothetical protein COZ56_12145 [Armatimonadetes bacterium CG_4_8_14_3_um_filter_58_9]PIY42782.1 MAG: hypothetical protein COZ05_12975 [Armatimonadetes bacterium CG_4_10_14_3_um_filter_59_10]PJB78115.1 MAG: hypothetical protein CO095_008